MPICRTIVAIEMQSDMPMPLILASASPRRRQLLTEMGCQFSVQAADIDESREAGEDPASYVLRMATRKAEKVHRQQPEAERGIAILAADTIVCQDQEIFAKPTDYSDAKRIWTRLANAEHMVITAVCLSSPRGVESVLVNTAVHFADIDEAQMRNYWDSGEPVDKAGAYAIQGLASAWVQLIHGSYSNVVGLPLRETNQLLTRVGHNWL